MLLFPITISVGLIALVGFAVRAEIQYKDKSSRHIFSTVASVAIAIVFYPMTIAPTGATANGGILGLTSLVIASAFSWWAFALNTESPWIRRLIQLPITALITFMAVHDAYCQYVGGWWWGL